MNTHRGFTLIEVLIAALILFSAIAVTAELYQSSLLSASKASNSAAFYQTHPVSISVIKSKLMEQYKDNVKPHYTGEFTISGIHYKWQADRQAFKSRAPDRLNNDPLVKRFSLFNILVEATRDKKVNQFNFEVVAW